MKGDFTRLTFDPKKHYSSVRMQQGRVQLDSDYNEFVDIMLHRDRTMTRDLIGGCGGPEDDAGFKLICHVNDATTDSEKDFLKQNKIDFEKGDFLIGKGRYYVNGHLCESDYVTFFKQPDMPEIPQDIKQNGHYLAFLDVWERHITVIEDPDIREVALGGPDTTTRTKTVWQVKLLEIKENLENSPCSQDFEAWNDLTKERPSKMGVNRNSTGSVANSPLIGGYRAATNQLYRVEIHTASIDGKTATIKWSRDNGSVVRAITNIDGDKLTVENTSQDLGQAFAGCTWAEVTDDQRESNEKPGTMIRLKLIEGNTITFDQVESDKINLQNFPLDPERHTKIRRWDHQTASPAIDIKSESIPLDSDCGIEVYFDQESSVYRSGDYWLIPARTGANSELSIEWEKDETGKYQMVQRFGVEHQYSKLAILERANGEWKPLNDLNDCRVQFPSATDLDDKLEKLNRKPCGGCMVIVGPRESGGQYPRLDLAIDNLMKDPNIHDISICLLPGDHELPRGLCVKDYGKTPTLNVHITGTGRGTRLNLGGSQQILVENLASFTLANMDIVVGEREEKNPIVLSNCVEILMRRCKIRGRENEEKGKTTLLTIIGAQYFTLENCILEYYTNHMLSMFKRAFGVSEDLENLFKITERSSFMQQTMIIAEKFKKKNEFERKILRGQLTKSIESLPEISVYRAFADSYDSFLTDLESGRSKDYANKLADIFEDTHLFFLADALCIIDCKSDAIISDCEIIGVLNLYGEYSQGLDPANFDKTKFVEIFKKQDRNSLIQFTPNHSTLLMQGNRINSIKCGKDFVSILKEYNSESFGLACRSIFRRITLNNNIIKSTDNLWIAREVIFTANRFDHLSTISHLGMVIAEISIYLGNSSEIFQKPGSEVGLPILHNIVRGELVSSGLGVGFPFFKFPRSQESGNILIDITNTFW